VLLPLLLKLVVMLLGAPADLEPSRHDALLRKAAIDTCLHRRPYGVEARVQILAASPRFLVDTLHAGDPQPAPGCHGKHLSGILERLGYLLALCRHRASCPHALQLFIRHDETAADGIVDSLQEQRAASVVGIERHAIGVPAQRRLLVQNEIDRRVKAVGRVAGRRYSFPCHNGGHDSVSFVRIHRLGRLPGKAEDDRTIGAMPDTRIGKRTVEAGTQPFDPGVGRTRPVAAANLIEEASRCRHWPHRMRTRGTYANLEKVENGKEHVANSEKPASHIGSPAIFLPFSPQWIGACRLCMAPARHGQGWISFPATGKACLSCRSANTLRGQATRARQGWCWRAHLQDHRRTAKSLPGLKSGSPPATAPLQNRPCQKAPWPEAYERPRSPAARSRPAQA